MAGWDWAVIGAYFAALVVVVWWSSKRQDTSEDYFLAGRNIGWFAVGASLFASNIGSEHIVGLSGQGASSGMAMAHWELHAWVMIMLAWVFVPFYYRSGVFTMPEFLERRFSPAARWMLSVVSLVAYVFTKVSVTVYAGALVFEALLPDLSLHILGQVYGPFWIGAFATVIATGVYTIFGGLRAVLYTDTAQAIVLLAGSFFITLFGLRLLGGWGELISVCKTDATRFALWRPLSDPDFPWLGVLIASPVIGIWYWCTDQYIVQRTLAAKNLTNARRGAIWGGFLKVWPVMIFLIPGMIGYALHQKGMLQIPLKDSGGIQGDMVFATMVKTLLPTGLRGLVVGGLLAALMSSLSSLFNSSASLFTVDIYEKIRPGRSERHLVAVGRVATGVVVALGMLWIPVMHTIGQGGLYKYLQSVQGYLAPPITAVFLLGLFWKRINSAGAVAGLALGFILGMVKLVLEACAGAGYLESMPWLEAVATFNFLYASGVLLLISVIIIVGVSLLSPPPPAEQIAGLTYATASPEQRRENRQSWNWIDIFGTVVVLGLVLGMYTYFTVWLR
ncbi:MAG: sodium/solute symporter [Phycisphaerae bacterium]|nr:sodium/solute symporter [Phycisphaerae bacterium]